MVDYRNPTEQFHSYQPPDATPVSEARGASGWMSRLGLNPASMRGVTDTMSNVNVRDSVAKARGYAAANPGKVLGGLAALVIGAGLMRGRGMAR